MLLLASVAQAATQNPGGSGFMDTIAGQYKSATIGWMTTAQGYAEHIFASLAVLDLAWWGIKNVLKKNDLTDFITGATLKISSIFFFYTIVSYAPTWMPLITSSFVQMGQGIGGAGGATTPSGIMSEAFSVIASLWDTVQNNASWWHLGNDMLFALVAASTSILGLIGFGLVALQLFMTQIEMYLVGGAGLVMLGFTGSGLTSSFGEKYIGYMISIGIKLLVIYAIVGLGQQLINSENAYIGQWANTTGGTTPNPLDLLSIGVTMLIYGVIGMQVPGLAGSLMNGSPNMSLGNVAGGAAAIAGGVAAAGAAAVAGAAGAAQGLAKMADLVGAGAGGVGGAAGGIGGATDGLAALSSATGGGSSAGASMGSGSSSGTQSGSAGAASSPAAAVPGNSATDALGAGTQSGTGSASAGAAADASKDRKDSPNHWKTMGDQLGKLADKKDDIARHEGSTGGGIQIRLNHME